MAMTDVDIARLKRKLGAGPIRHSELSADERLYVASETIKGCVVTAIKEFSSKSTFAHNAAVDRLSLAQYHLTDLRDWMCPSVVNDSDLLPAIQVMLLDCQWKISKAADTRDVKLLKEVSGIITSVQAVFNAADVKYSVNPLRGLER